MKSSDINDEELDMITFTLTWKGPRDCGGMPLHAFNIQYAIQTEKDNSLRLNPCNVNLK